MTGITYPANLLLYGNGLCVVIRRHETHIPWALVLDCSRLSVRGRSISGLCKCFCLCWDGGSSWANIFNENIRRWGDDNLYGKYFQRLVYACPSDWSISSICNQERNRIQMDLLYAKHRHSRVFCPLRFSLWDWQAFKQIFLTRAVTSKPC